ncbi:hypothetical protein DNTS_016538 [Danionella cerebrum]|uniref:Myb-like domain-containing protein n=1 Tax=Danionella cerebrum TaxID=2873325 RepID=A0A553RC40_9TELE|nr:hypothetical protein DNTS_016538 [Danionella translucida]
MEELDSRSFGRVLQSCQFLCEFHSVWQRKNDLFRQRQEIGRTSNFCTPVPVNIHSKITQRSRGVLEHNVKNQRENHSSSQQQYIRLTPLKRPSRRSSLSQSSEMGWDCRNQSSRKHRGRRNWLPKELLYLTDGVKKFGTSWNSILWKYPFQSGRSNVDLAKKYHQMQAGPYNSKAKAQGEELPGSRDV